MGAWAPKRFSPDAAALGLFTLLLAAILRTVHIAYREVFGGEFATLDYLAGNTRYGWGEGILYGYLPLYYMLMKGWSAIADTSSEVWLRLPSVIFGLTAFVAFFVYAHRYLKGLALVICLTAFALNPILIAEANSATVWSLVALFTVMANYFCIRALDEGSPFNWGRYAAVCAAGALTHPFFWFLLVAHALFALGRPRRTPKPALAVAVVVLIAAVMGAFVAAYSAQQSVPSGLALAAPGVDDLMRGLVSVVFGNFSRYGINEFFQAFYYLFLLAALGLSIVYYRMRVMEASMLPENVMWIDETQDVVGFWRRLSLPAFLVFHWVAFLVPALCMMFVASAVRSISLQPEYFLICLPPILILIATGLDVVPNRLVTLGLGIVMIVMMTVYSGFALRDKGLGVYDAIEHVKRRDFNQAADRLLFVPYSQRVERALALYGEGIEPHFVSTRGTVREVQAHAAEAVPESVERVFALYHNDWRTYGQARRSPVREWFAAPEHGWRATKSIPLSRAERSELVIYERRKPGDPPDDPAVLTPPPEPKGAAAAATDDDDLPTTPAETETPLPQ